MCPIGARCHQKGSGDGDHTPNRGDAMHQDLRLADQQRRQWINERRASVIAAYDAEAATYDRHPYPNRPQQAWVKRLLTLCPDHGIVLDAPCGTGRYFPLVAAAGRRVVGIDQSANMLAAAQRRGIAIDLQHVGLQELSFVERFDAVMTIDAMENVAPEDWPEVLTILHRALRPGGHLYLTIEEQPDADLSATHDALIARGLPALPGELIDGDLAGYRYYPGREQVIEWIVTAGLTLIDEAYHQEDGWGYRHVLLQRPTRAPRRARRRRRRAA
jgi:cyclopropane fatty-acyl-phospholipid synthase-like methyltransferase